MRTAPLTRRPAAAANAASTTPVNARTARAADSTRRTAPRWSRDERPATGDRDSREGPARAARPDGARQHHALRRRKRARFAACAGAARAQHQDVRRRTDGVSSGTLPTGEPCSDALVYGRPEWAE